MAGTPGQPEPGRNAHGVGQIAIPPGTDPFRLIALPDILSPTPGGHSPCRNPPQEFDRWDCPVRLSWPVNRSPYCGQQTRNDALQPQKAVQNNADHNFRVMGSFGLQYIIPAWLLLW